MLSQYLVFPLHEGLMMSNIDKTAKRQSVKAVCILSTAPSHQKDCFVNRGVNKACSKTFSMLQEWTEFQSWESQLPCLSFSCSLTPVTVLNYVLRNIHNPPCSCTSDTSRVEFLVDPEVLTHHGAFLCPSMKPG